MKHEVRIISFVLHTLKHECGKCLFLVYLSKLMKMSECADWVGPLEGIWNDTTCPNIGGSSFSTVKLCQDACEATPDCSAINYNDGIVYCVLRNCGMPVPPTSGTLTGWNGYKRVCGGEYNSSYGNISHPLNGGDYSNNENCIWIIRTSDPIKITFISFDTEGNRDFLVVRDELYNLGVYTGSSVPTPIHTTTNVTYLHFTSDFSIVGTGFELYWEPAESTPAITSTPTPGLTQGPT
ncbi:unnamed protein product, partial [Meganyctiphanes norvegica]